MTDDRLLEVLLHEANSDGPTDYKHRVHARFMELKAEIERLNGEKDYMRKVINQSHKDRLRFEAGVQADYKAAVKELIQLRAQLTGE